MNRGGGHGILVRIARRVARAVVPRAFWPIVDDDLREEISERQRLGWAHWRVDLWGAAQYASVAGRLAVERMIPTLRDGHPGSVLVGGGWSLDLKRALRVLGSRPATTATVLVTIVLAIGATTAVYTVVHGVLLSPLPYPEPDRLARIWQTKADWQEVSEAEFRSRTNRLEPLAPSYYDWLGADTGFESLGAYVDAAFVLQRADGAQALLGQEATSGLFETLGVQPILGRYLQPVDDAADSPPVVVLGEAFWRGHFGGRSDALGADLILDGRPHAVVGVMPAGFEAPSRASWMLPPGDPLLWTSLGDEARRGWKNVSVVGRLRPGVSLEASSHSLAMAQVTAVYPEYRGAWAESLMDSVVGDVRSTLWFLLTAVGLTLVVVTVNVANILTASGLSRRREMAIRIALGAGSGRLARGLLVETAVMAALGGLGGILVAWLGLPLLLRLLPPSLPRAEGVEMSTGVLLFGLTVTGVTALLVGMVPAFLAARADPQDTLRSTSHTISRVRASATARGALVMMEVSLAFVLLVGAGLLSNSYLRLWSMERGFDTRGLVAMRVAPDPERYGTEEERDLFAETLAARLGEVPGVRATAVNNLPLSGQRSGTRVYLERPGVELEVVDSVLLTVVLNNYLDVVGIPVLAGRGFESSDGPGTPLVAIVSETMARRFWPGGTVIGRHLRTFDDSITSIEIVGVATDVRHEGLAAALAPTVYLPASQSRRDTHEMVLRVRGDIAQGVQSARAVVARLSPATPMGRVLVVDEAIADSVAIPRFRTIMVVALAGLAAVIALLGLYGVVAFEMAQRTKEIGVRMALGARPRSILLWAVAGGVRLGGAGVALGLLIAMVASDVMAAFLFEIAPTDPLTYLGVTITVLAVCIAATAVPARRAATVDPVRVLKSE